MTTFLAVLAILLIACQFIIPNGIALVSAEVTTHLLKAGRSRNNQMGEVYSIQYYFSQESNVQNGDISPTLWNELFTPPPVGTVVESQLDITFDGTFSSVSPLPPLRIYVDLSFPSDNSLSSCNDSWCQYPGIWWMLPMDSATKSILNGKMTMSWTGIGLQDAFRPWVAYKEKNQIGPEIQPDRFIIDWIIPTPHGLYLPRDGGNGIGQISFTLPINSDNIISFTGPIYLRLSPIKFEFPISSDHPVGLSLIKLGGFSNKGISFELQTNEYTVPSGFSPSITIEPFSGMTKMYSKYSDSSCSYTSSSKPNDNWRLSQFISGKIDFETWQTATSFPRLVTITCEGSHWISYPTHMYTISGNPSGELPLQVHLAQHIESIWPLYAGSIIDILAVDHNSLRGVENDIQTHNSTTEMFGVTQSGGDTIFTLVDKMVRGQIPAQFLMASVTNSREFIDDEPGNLYWIDLSDRLPPYSGPTWNGGDGGPEDGTSGNGKFFGILFGVFFGVCALVGLIILFVCHCSCCQAGKAVAASSGANNSKKPLPIVELPQQRPQPLPDNGQHTYYQQQQEPPQPYLGQPQYQPNYQTPTAPPNKDKEDLPPAYHE